jgi:hypothetical protein
LKALRLPAGSFLDLDVTLTRGLKLLYRRYFFEVAPWELYMGVLVVVEDTMI